MLTFHKEYLQQVLQKRDLKDLHSHKNIFRQRGLVFHQQ